MDLTPSDLKTKDIYKLLTGSVVPRPIAWVSTVSEDGVHNLAPFSFFTVASTKPAILAISIGQGSGEREGTEKDTLANIRISKRVCHQCGVELSWKRNAKKCRERTCGSR